MARLFEVRLLVPRLILARRQILAGHAVAEAVVGQEEVKELEVMPADAVLVEPVGGEQGELPDLRDDVAAREADVVEDTEVLGWAEGNVGDRSVGVEERGREETDDDVVLRRIAGIETGGRASEEIDGPFGIFEATFAVGGDALLDGCEPGDFDADDDGTGDGTGHGVLLGVFQEEFLGDSGKLANFGG